MARIKNQTVYPIKVNPVGTDFFIISDSQDDGATKNVYISALQAALGSTIYTASDVIPEDRTVTYNDGLTFYGDEADSEFIVQHVSGPTFQLNEDGVFSTTLGVGTTSNDDSAILQINSTSQGFLPPRMSEVQRNAITSPAIGLTIFNTDSGVLETYNGSAWASNSDTNIYTTDGGISVDRTVSISAAGSLEIIAAGTIVNSFSSLNVEEDVISINARLNADYSSIIVGSGAMTVLDDINSRGLQYASDYSANYTDRSLVDKEYADGLLGSVDTLYTADGTIIDENRTVTLNDTNDSGELLTMRAIGTGVKTSVIAVGSQSLGLSISDTDTIGLALTPASAIFTDTFNNKGLQYAADYSANYTARSLVDKEYVDSAGGNIYNQDGVINTANRVVSGEVNSTLAFNMYDTNVSNFNTRGRVFVTSTSSNMSFATGDGAGAITAQMQMGFTSSGMLVTDDINSRGLQYAADYSANYVDRSLVDKEYVDGLVDGIGTLYSADGTISTDRTVTIGNGTILNFSIPGGSRNLLSLFNSEGDIVDIDADGVSIAATNYFRLYLEYLDPPTDGQLLGYDSDTDALIWYTPGGNFVTLDTEQTITETKSFDVVSGSALNILNDSNDFGVVIDNTSVGYGMYITNSAAGGVGIYNLNTNTGQSINIDNGGAGQGIFITNSAAGDGIYLENDTSGRGIYVEVSGTGNGIVSNVESGSVGYAYESQDEGSTVFSVDKGGNIETASTIKTGGYTVATLPAGAMGMKAYVTDATAPTYLGTLTGGGAVVCPVFHNGSAWVSC